MTYVNFIRLWLWSLLCCIDPEIILPPTLRWYQLSQALVADNRLPGHETQEKSRGITCREKVPAVTVLLQNNVLFPHRVQLFKPHTQTTPGPWVPHKFTYYKTCLNETLSRHSSLSCYASALTLYHKRRGETHVIINARKEHSEQHTKACVGIVSQCPSQVTTSFHSPPDQCSLSHCPVILQRPLSLAPAVSSSHCHQHDP